MYTHTDTGCYCTFTGIFESTDENKLEYTDIFTQYTTLIEENLIAELIAHVEVCHAAATPAAAINCLPHHETLPLTPHHVQGFTMERFIEVLSARQDELHADVYVSSC